MIGYANVMDGDEITYASTMTTGSSYCTYEKGGSKMDFSDMVNKITVSVCLAVVIACLGYWTFGGFATTVGYTIKSDSVANHATVSTPGPNVYYEVVEVRDSGRDKKIYSTFDIDDALRVMREFQK